MEEDPIENIRLDHNNQRLGELKELVIGIKTDLTSKMNQVNQLILDLKKAKPDSPEIGKALEQLRLTLLSIKLAQDSMQKQLTQKETLTKLNSLSLNLMTVNDKLDKLLAPKQALSDLEKDVFTALDEAMPYLNIMNQPWSQNLFTTYLKLKNSNEK